MDSVIYKLYKEIINASTSQELKDITDRVDILNDDGAFENKIELMILQTSILTKANTLMLKELVMEGSISIQMVLNDELSNIGDLEELQLNQLKEEELQEIKNGKVYKVQSLKKTKK